MKLSAPKQLTFWIAVILVVVGLLGALNIIGALSTYAFWLAFVGFVILAIGNLVKGF